MTYAETPAMSKKLARKVARRDRLFEILAWSRPHNSEIEQRFCREFLDKVPGMERDGFGNRYLRVGKDSTVLWSCHVDTVAKEGRLNALDYDAASGTLALKNGKAGQSLGADDGAGVWMMLEMIRGGKPGLYVFHRGEEKGCLGSKWVAQNAPELLAGIQMAIAFDRAGTRDIITHQAYGQCCSDAFAEALAAALNADEWTAFKFRPDPTGIYTDTNEYLRLVPECTNVSVGYESNHGPRETLDVWHVEDLLGAVLRLDVEALVVERDPADSWLDDYGMGGWGRTSSRKASTTKGSDKDFADTVRDNPGVAVELLREAGISLEDFEYLAWAQAKYDGRPFDEQYEDEIDWETAQ